MRFLFLILAALAFGCQSSSSKSSQVVRINIGDEPQTLDPRKARHLNCVVALNMLFEGLTRLDREGKTGMGAAERVDVAEDLKTFTFHLRECSWSNGDPVTAHDFVYAWKKALSPDFPSDVAHQLYVLKGGRAVKEGKAGLEELGVRAVDDKTLVVELENPTPYFLELVSFPAFFPVNRKVDQKDPGWTLGSADYVGNGPFQLADWRHQDQLVLRKNGTYWDAGQVKLDEVRLQMVTGETELNMFEKKELDWAGSPLSSLTPDALKSLNERGLVKSQGALGTYFIRVNTQCGPLKEPRIRKALALAINRKEIVDHVTHGSQVPAMGLVPPGLRLCEGPYFQDGDRVEARRLFEEGLGALQMKREDFPEIGYLYRQDDRNHLIAQAVQQQWRDALGIRVRLEPMESKVFFSRMGKQDYQLAYGSWVADFADPINFLEVFKYKTGSNNTLWENPRYAELLDLSSKTPDAKKRFELMAQSEQILMEEMPIIPVLYLNMLYLSQSGLKDVVLSSLGGLDLKWASLEEPR